MSEIFSLLPARMTWVKVGFDGRQKVAVFLQRKSRPRLKNTFPRSQG